MTFPDAPRTATPCAAAAQGQACPSPGVSLRCIDVSHHQGAIDWRAVAQWLGPDGFAYVKATEDSAFRDPMLARNLSSARAAGVRVGVYHFFRSQSAAYALAEAVHFLDVYGDLHELADLAPALDLEEPQVGHADIGTPALAWLDRVAETLGVAPVVYTSPAFAQAHGFAEHAPRLADFPLWLAAWRSSPPEAPAPWSDWAIWQTGKGRVPGVNGECDVNQARRVPT